MLCSGCVQVDEACALGGMPRVNKWLDHVVDMNSVSAYSTFQTMSRQAHYRARSLNHLFEHARATDDWETGDLAMYTRDMMDKRCNLRYERNILIELERFWTLASTVLDEEEKLAGACRKAEYLIIFKKMYRALNDVTGVHGEATMKKEVEDDWMADAHIKDLLTREMMLDSIFDLADKWTDTVPAPSPAWH